MIPEPTLNTGSMTLANALRSLGVVDNLVTYFKRLVDEGLAVLPLPGHGQTLERWRRLALVAAHDLPLLKLFEGHTDAAAILAELGDSARATPGSRWGVWAAEPPNARVTISHGDAGRSYLSGRKSWCSGAEMLTHALVTCWNEDTEPYLAAIALDQPGVRITNDGWCAVGMAATRSVDVIFDQAEAVIIGDANAYLDRPGFWAGGIGIAACWYGAAAALAASLVRKVSERSDPLDTCHLGAVDIALGSAREMLMSAAAEIDMDIRHCTQVMALRTRLAVEHAAEETIRHVGHAVGAGPYCRDPVFAQLAADLPVFLRQSHAERDLASLGQSIARDGVSWTL